MSDIRRDRGFFVSGNRPCATTEGVAPYASMSANSTARFRLLGVLAAAAFAASGCVFESSSAVGNPLEDTALWKRYTELPDERALALAGDPERIWVAGMAGGHPTVEDALRDALAECSRQRERRRMQAPCHAYATGSDVLWAPVHGSSAGQR